MLLVRACREHRVDVASVASSLALALALACGGGSDATGTGTGPDSSGGSNRPVAKDVADTACPLLTACLAGGLRGGAMFLLGITKPLSALHPVRDDDQWWRYTCVPDKMMAMQECLAALLAESVHGRVQLRMQYPRLTKPAIRSLSTTFGFPVIVPGRRDARRTKLRDSIRDVARALLAFSEGSVGKLLDMQDVEDVENELWDREKQLWEKQDDREEATRSASNDRDRDRDRDRGHGGVVQFVSRLFRGFKRRIVDAVLGRFFKTETDDIVDVYLRRWYESLGMEIDRYLYYRLHEGRWRGPSEILRIDRKLCRISTYEHVATKRGVCGEYYQCMDSRVCGAVQRAQEKNMRAQRRAADKDKRRHNYS